MELTAKGRRKKREKGTGGRRSVRRVQKGKGRRVRGEKEKGKEKRGSITCACWGRSACNPCNSRRVGEKEGGGEGAEGRRR